MSEEFKIPPDLSVFESQLSSLAVPDSSLDRDEVLYQAGWAAAMAHSSAATPNGFSGGSSNGKSWAWPTATGVFATLATVLAVALFLQTNALDRAGLNAVASIDAGGDSGFAKDDLNSNAVANDGADKPFKSLGGKWADDAGVDDGLRGQEFEGMSNRQRRLVIDLESDPAHLLRAIGSRLIDGRLIGEQIDDDFFPTVEANRGGVTNVKATSKLLQELSPVPVMRQNESKQKSWFSKSWEAVL